MFTLPDSVIEDQDSNGVFPPSTVGEVGRNHYVQMIQSAGATVVTVYDKSTHDVLAGPVALDALWPEGGRCANGRGTVLYDHLEDRWLLSASQPADSQLCVYISRTDDPVAGGWFLYEFQASGFPDYPKAAVWPDAYYLSTSERSPAAYAFERHRMLLGEPATFQKFTAPELRAFDLQALTPGDLDGQTPPPPGEPGIFMRHCDDEAHNPEANDPYWDHLELWEFHVDFSNPNNSAFIGPINIPVVDFDSDLCGFSSSECFSQPNMTTAIDPMREILLSRLQYRSFATHETLVGNFVTDVDGRDHGGIRWFELRRLPGQGWSVFQEGTYAPDRDHRWMGSISMDRTGNIALGFGVSSTNTFPAIRYVGRLAEDPLGTMPQGEVTLTSGAGLALDTPATNSVRLWGDYSAINVDPADDCTFWYTNEYAEGIWHTVVGRFKFEVCGDDEEEDAPSISIAEPQSGTLIEGSKIKVTYEQSGELSEVSHVHLSLDGRRGDGTRQ